jgi:hypothetical protein
VVTISEANFPVFIMIVQFISRLSVFASVFKGALFVRHAQENLAVAVGVERQVKAAQIYAAVRQLGDSVVAE